MEAIAAIQDDSSGANPSSVKSEDGSPRPEGGRGSPPPNCAICLGACRNKSFTDSCLHQFCFKCLLTWSKVKAECPLCKQNFRSIIHNVRSNHQYEEYLVEQRVDEVAERIDIDALTTATRRFRYRTTLTFPRRESLAIQQLLLHYPLVAEALPPRAPPARRRRSPAAFRRTVYRHNLWARPLPDFTGRFRDCRPEFYRYNDTQMHRLVPWLNRELHYLLNENIGHISYVLTRILELLPQHHINSPEFRENMQRYFGERTDHFLHELYCFASTPYDMTGYDRNVQYTTDSRVSSMVNEVISSSESDASVDSDIVMVSSSHPPEPPLAGPSGTSGTAAPAPQYPHHYIPPPPPAADTDCVIPIETISQSDSDNDSEVMVVGYIKPPQDRTPEVVDLLGSDSDVIVQDNEPPVQQQPLQSLVKLSLRRHAARRGSDSSTSYRPPHRRRRSHGSASTRATGCTSTRALYTDTDTLSLTTTSCDTFSDTFSDALSDTFSSSDTDSDRRGARKRKAKRKHRKKKSKKRSSSRSRRRERRGTEQRQEPSTSTDKRRKRKSSSGKGVKSSRRMSEALGRQPSQERDIQTPPLPPAVAGPSAASPPGTPPLTPQTSPPRAHKRRRSSRDSRRLRSVVNVMSRNTSDDSNPSNALNNFLNRSSEATTSQEYQFSNLDSSFNLSIPMATRVPPNQSDSEDDLPLNLTIQKSFTSL